MNIDIYPPNAAGKKVKILYAKCLPISTLTSNKHYLMILLISLIKLHMGDNRFYRQFMERERERENRGIKSKKTAAQILFQDEWLQCGSLCGNEKNN